MADLTGADMSGVNLANSAVIYAQENDAILTNADLIGAEMNGADLTSVKWSNTICPD